MGKFLSFSTLKWPIIYGIEKINHQKITTLKLSGMQSFNESFHIHDIKKCWTKIVKQNIYTFADYGQGKGICFDGVDLVCILVEHDIDNLPLQREMPNYYSCWMDQTVDLRKANWPDSCTCGHSTRPADEPAQYMPRTAWRSRANRARSDSNNRW